MRKRTQRSMTGAEVRRIRRRLGLTQRTFANVLRVHWNTVAKWEQNVIGLRPSTAELIRRVAADRGRQRKSKRDG